MIITLSLIIISIMVLFIASCILSIGGTLFVVLFADIIVALGIIWLVTLCFSNDKTKKKSKTKKKK